MYLIIIDANVWIKFARSKDIAPLLGRLVTYNLLPVVNNYLLSEIFEALVNNKWTSVGQAASLIEYIKKLTLTTTERSVYRLSPDPKDNYLFDLAIQNNAVFIISDDNRLLELRFKAKPVYSTNWFLKQFPV